MGQSWVRFPNSHLHVCEGGRDMMLLCEMQKSGEMNFDVQFIAHEIFQSLGLYIGFGGRLSNVSLSHNST